MAQAAEAEHADQAIRSRRFNHRARFFDDGLGTTDERCTPFIQSLYGKASRKIGEALGEPGKIVGCDGLAAPDIIGGELPEAGNLRDGLRPRLIVAISDVNIPHHYRISA